jgi:hypothetical protein
MASGIYRLTFSSGKFYIGKSLDLETRWKQHFNKFATGKAARPMQVEYDRWGLPDTEVMFYCHQDHIDIMEEWLIDEYKCGDMLNTTYPKITRTDEVANLINRNNDLLKLSTWEHMQLLDTLKQEVARRTLLQEAAEHETEQLRSEGYIMDSDYEQIVDVATDLREELQNVQQQLKRLQNLSWWNRLFNYSVYV